MKIFVPLLSGNSCDKVVWRPGETKATYFCFSSPSLSFLSYPPSQGWETKLKKSCDRIERRFQILFRHLLSPHCLNYWTDILKAKWGAQWIHALCQKSILNTILGRLLYPYRDSISFGHKDGRPPTRIKFALFPSVCHAKAVENFSATE